MLYAYTPEETPVPSKLGLDDLEITEDKAGQMIQDEVEGCKVFGQWTRDVREGHVFIRGGK